MDILLNDSSIDQLTEGVKLNHSQAILELAAKPLPEARLLLLISIHVVSHILEQGVESLRVLQHIVVALFQSQKLCKLPSDHPRWNMVGPEGFLELSPSEPSTLREHGHVILPPCVRGAPQLLGCQSYFIPIIVWV